MSQPQSSLGPIGVAGALAARNDPTRQVKPTLWDEFALTDRVALVTGANRGLGLEMALALAEAGARVVYCVDLAEQPGEEWSAASEYLSRMGTGGRLEYVSLDVRDQKAVWKLGQEIGDKEGRLDACIAAAGVAAAPVPCVELTEEALQKVLSVNLNGVLYTAQAAGQQMIRFGNRGSIILIASVAGSVALKDLTSTSYCTSKSGVLQMARNMACELGPKGIRVNTLSPGYIRTPMTAGLISRGLEGSLSSQNPLGRIGRPDELRGVIAWLASDASTFCTGSDIQVSGGHQAW
ncbi:hypothetical protein BC834DRAFT_829413 [Gloeopeniophorella convolvens]|nr:hypothetical protein BC834DRAFT_829413 [Gloeopeniophorella convolvens]